MNSAPFTALGYVSLSTTTPGLPGVSSTVASARLPPASAVTRLAGDARRSCRASRVWPSRSSGATTAGAPIPRCALGGTFATQRRLLPDDVLRL